MKTTSLSATTIVRSSRAMAAVALLAVGTLLSACASSSNPNVGYVFSEHTTGYGAPLSGDHSYAGR